MLQSIERVFDGLGLVSVRMSHRTRTRPVKMTEPTNERANPLTQSNMPPPDLTPGFYPDSPRRYAAMGRPTLDRDNAANAATSHTTGRPAGYYPDAQV
jgi:hypothetical protein